MSSRADFIARFKGSLLDSVRAFADADLERQAETALAAYSLLKPKICVTVVELSAGRSLYACPDDLKKVQACYWGRHHKAHGQPWDDDYVGHLPEWGTTRNAAGARFLRAMPAPSARQLGILGSTAEVEYRADWSWEEIDEGEHLVMLRAQAEAMRELSMKNATTAYNIREGISATPKNGTPAYLYEQLLAEFERQVAR